MTAVIAREGEGPLSRFRGPPLTVNPWGRILQRLEQKRIQSSQSPYGVWFRVDFLDGIWQFSEWASYRLEQKLAVMEKHLREQFSGAEGLAGITVSTGAALAQGAFAEESVKTADGSVGLRRNLVPVRVRETLIVPLAAEATDVAAFIAEAYAAEPTALDGLLRRAGLAAVNEVFAARHVTRR